ncbi:hypothetical protein OOK29_10005 [Streptomyces phaeochromogenes]|uniref:hypothetical protein n=1 Tax=Streptomyces phaeochromogenes TaxID=1923 RepID=UPI00225871AF|nr:hypothetical protein [Streptomyces phaeochromogenes]MCX5598472.1 hypothetical protein [Streptomyces phaeochromogenes]
MALADDIEFYGRAVADQTLTRAAAAQALARASGGGLTEYGAGMAIDQWKSVRAAYEQESRKAGDIWARCFEIVPPDWTVDQ